MANLMITDDFGHISGQVNRANNLYVMEIHTEHDTGPNTSEMFELTREQAIQLAFHLAQFIEETK